MEIRDLTGVHAPKVERMTIGGRPRERYLLEVRELVRDHLPDYLRAGACSAIGGFDGGELTALAAWAAQPDDPSTWRVIVIAVAEGHAHRGHGSEMKLAVIERARQRGVRTIVSYVHVDNVAAQRMNDALGGRATLDPGDPLKNWLIYVLEI